MAKDKAKAKSKKDKDEKKSKKGGKGDALAAARAAKKSGKGGKAKSKKKGLPVFKAPEGTKPFFMKVGVLVDKDGIITDMKATRIKGGVGNIDDEKKTVDMLEWDPNTVRRLLGRYAGKAFINQEKKRLPQGLATMIMRVSVNRDTGAIKVSIKDIKFKEGKEGKLKLLDKKDAKYRALRKPARFLPAAFTKVKDFPTAAELKAMRKEDEAEEEQVLEKKSKGKKKVKPEKKAKKVVKKAKSKKSKK